MVTIKRNLLPLKPVVTDMASPPLAPTLPPSTASPTQSDTVFGKYWLTKKELADFLRIHSSGVDRARAAKEAGDPDYADFPSDHRPSGNPKGHLRFKASEALKWAHKHR